MLGSLSHASCFRADDAPENPRRSTMSGAAMENGDRRTSLVVNPWIIAVAVTIATLMEVLDTSIANVALRYIAGGLSAAQADSEWVIAS
jgi:hypothetical protein